ADRLEVDALQRLIGAVAVAQGEPHERAGGDETLKSIDIKPVSIRGELKLGFTFHHQTRDLIQNHPPAGAIGQLRKLLGQDFRQGFLYATTADLLYDTQGKSPKLTRMAPSSKGAATLEHDRTKKRLIPAGKPYLEALGVTDADGNVLKNSGDKFRQINRYVEILAPLLQAIPAERMRRILDMGAGKGYLTFAVADYVANTLKRETDVVGVEFRDELVTLCNGIAERSQLEHLSFSAGSIQNFDSTGADVLIALHACDTATDDAIAKGIASVTISASRSMKMPWRVTKSRSVVWLAVSISRRTCL
ncbi:MAG: SAM-dependent methyltransferase, partial [Rhizobiaceae bacterium]